MYCIVRERETIREGIRFRNSKRDIFNLYSSSATVERFKCVPVQSQTFITRLSIKYPRFTMFFLFSSLFRSNKDHDFKNATIFMKTHFITNINNSKICINTLILIYDGICIFIIQKFVYFIIKYLYQFQTKI